MKPVSVIIPVGPNDESWHELLSQLALPEGSEILLCGVAEKQVDLPDLATVTTISFCDVYGGRAGNMNAGASKARHDWLWFLHADSRLQAPTLEAMGRVVDGDQRALYFFDLVFAGDGPVAMKLNQWAVRFRAGWMKIPFGDQGFLLRKDLFEQMGGYREDLPYGEDHVFVWKVRQEGYSVKRAGAGLMTSARKYKRGGWSKVTALHVWLTIRQAVPQWVLLQRRRLERMLR